MGMFVLGGGPAGFSPVIILPCLSSGGGGGKGGGGFVGVDAVIAGLEEKLGGRSEPPTFGAVED